MGIAGDRLGSTPNKIRQSGEFLAKEQGGEGPGKLLSGQGNSC